MDATNRVEKQPRHLFEIIVLMTYLAGTCFSNHNMATEAIIRVYSCEDCSVIAGEFASGEAAEAIINLFSSTLRATHLGCVYTNAIYLNGALSAGHYYVGRRPVNEVGYASKKFRAS